MSILSYQNKLPDFQACQEPEAPRSTRVIEKEQLHSRSKLEQSNHSPLNYRGNKAFSANWNVFYFFLLFCSRSPVCDPLRKLLTPESPVGDRIRQTGDQNREFSPDILGQVSKAVPDHVHVRISSNPG